MFFGESFCSALGEASEPQHCSRVLLIPQASGLKQCLPRVCHTVTTNMPMSPMSVIEECLTRSHKCVSQHRLTTSPTSMYYQSASEVCPTTMYMCVRVFSDCPTRVPSAMDPTSYLTGVLCKGRVSQIASVSPTSVP